jgi:hypothetical protein
MVPGPPRPRWLRPAGDPARAGGPDAAPRWHPRGGHHHHRRRAVFHNCLGYAAELGLLAAKEFGFAEATLVLASLAARWNLSVKAGTRVSPAARAVLVPKSFPVGLSSRAADLIGNRARHLT